MRLNFIRNFARNRKKTAVFIVILLLAGGYMVYRLNQAPAATGSQNTAEAAVTRGTIEVTVTGTGTIVPVAAQGIGSNASGTVKKLYINNGQRVKKGDILAELTNDTLTMQVAKARLDLEKAGLIMADSAQQLSADTIIAPISGRIVNLQAKTGDQVSSNSAIATLQDDSQLVFDMPVSSYVAGKVAVNQKVEVFLPDQGSTVEGRVTAKNSQPVAGYNGESRTYIKVVIPATGNLTSGTKAFGTVTVDGKPVDALSVSTLEWIGESQLKATLNGKITGIYVQNGQVVKKGQKLFALGSDTNLTQQKTQQFSYQEARLNLTDLEQQQADLMVKAPIDGVVSGLDANEGDDVASSGNKSSSTSSSSSTTAATASTTSASKSLGKVVNTGQMEVSFPVDEVDIAKVKLGQTANILVDALPEKKFSGKVTDIAQEGTVTNNVSSFNITILVDNPESQLKSGMTANVTIVVAKKADTLLIPIEALQDKGQRKFVLTPAAPGSTQGRNIKRVTTGLTNESYAEITEGLQEGDKILLPAQQSSANRQGFGIGGMGGGRDPGSNRNSTGGSRNSGGGGNQSGSGGNRGGN